VSVEARFAGECPACDQEIRMGDAIRRDPLDGGGESWVHARCPAEVKPRPVCTSCFMEIALSGECGCAA